MVQAPQSVVLRREAQISPWLAMGRVDVLRDLRSGLIWGRFGALRVARERCGRRELAADQFLVLRKLASCERLANLAVSWAILLRVDPWGLRSSTSRSLFRPAMRRGPISARNRMVSLSVVGVRPAVVVRVVLSIDDFGVRLAKPLC